MRSARLIGVSTAAAALTLGVANTALACNIRDFSAVATCDDNGKGVIRVTDTDASGTPAVVTLYIKMSVEGEDDRNLDTKTIEHPTAQGAGVDFAWDWSPGQTYRIHVKAGNQVDEDIQPLLTTPSQGCGTPTPTPTPTPSASASAPAAATPSAPSADTPSATPTEPSGSPAASPQGGSGSHLAETGGGNGTGLIAGMAAALVVAGGGVVFTLRRRRTSGSH
ncbi:LAETG motif-containing sortase-dependent surface protein [Streptomyces sp. NPDC002888]|uniref:LAETG motif-containing sortase-dependent surface protein n=1 Tax=Streptomyces sp. NPDC002888 TaxID=3364668 RepID=UPI00368E8384